MKLKFDCFEADLELRCARELGLRFKKAEIKRGGGLGKKRLTLTIQQRHNPKLKVFWYSSRNKVLQQHILMLQQHMLMLQQHMLMLQQHMLMLDNGQLLWLFQRL